MTREEAINILNGDNLNRCAQKEREALDMAIQALSQEPCERFEWGIDGNVYKITKAKDEKEICQQVCKDAISREAVLEGIEELKKSPWATDKRGNGFEYLITEALDVVKDLCVKQLPSVMMRESEDKESSDGENNK